MIVGPERIGAPSVYWTTFKMLYSDLEETFRFVEPCNEHLHVFSHRYYELLLRASTEFESLCKEKVLEFKLTEKTKGDSFSIKDYYELNGCLENKPSIASVGYLFTTPYFVTPLEGWQTSHVLGWYQDYNNVKHGRVLYFKNANLGNVLRAIAAIFVLLERMRLVPPAKLAVLDGDSRLLRHNEEWPVVMAKPWK